MSTHARRLAARSLCALSLCALLAPARAHAWESVCRQYTDTTLAPAQYATMDAPACEPDAGPNVARNRWIGGLDEHRQLWERTARLAGLPASLSDTVQLRVFTGSATVAVGPSALPSLAPVAFADAARAQTRAFTIGELAQLPDFSYALWDWAQGNETCPLDGAPAGMDAEQCHDFASHMGPVNANHFLPLAGEFFARGHALALERARECRAMRDALGPDAQRFGAYVNDCETEALALEAVAQHYLQDAWSMGHQWQRWGSPELADFPGADPVEQHARAVLVALASGLIHGARGVLQKVPAWTGFDVDDALCAPSDDVRFVLGGEASHGLGDDYLAQLLPAQAGDAAPAAFAQQHDRLFACTVASALEVYRAAGENHGAADATLAATLAQVSPTGPECLGQRATNRAMLTAAGVQVRLLGQQIDVPLDARVASVALPVVANLQGRADLSRSLGAQFRLALIRTASLARVRAAQAPDATDLAEGGLGDFLDAHPNGAYAGRGGVASYSDPALPWPATSDAAPHASERALTLARLFHRAHASDWCAALSSADLDALRARPSDPSLDATAHAAACEACVEFATRHVRAGAPGAYDTTAEPLCHYLAPAPAYVYQQPPPQGASADELARAWCGCVQ